MVLGVVVDGPKKHEASGCTRCHFSRRWGPNEEISAQPLLHFWQECSILPCVVFGSHAYISSCSSVGLSVCLCRPELRRLSCSAPTRPDQLERWYSSVDPEFHPHSTPHPGHRACAYVVWESKTGFLSPNNKLQTPPPPNSHFRPPKVRGYGLTGDAHHIAAPTEDGDGPRRAMLSAIGM